MQFTCKKHIVENIENLHCEQNLADAVGIESYDVAQFAHAAMLNKLIGRRRAFRMRRLRSL